MALVCIIKTSEKNIMYYLVESSTDTCLVQCDSQFFSILDGWFPNGSMDGWGQGVDLSNYICGFPISSFCFASFAWHDLKLCCLVNSCVFVISLYSWCVDSFIFVDYLSQTLLIFFALRFAVGIAIPAGLRLVLARNIIFLLTLYVQLSLLHLKLFLRTGNSWANTFLFTLILFD